MKLVGGVIVNAVEVGAVVAVAIRSAVNAAIRNVANVVGVRSVAVMATRRAKHEPLLRCRGGAGFRSW